MIIALCIDDNLGMMFNKRRQSQDRVLRENLLAEAEGRTLWMSPYSYKQFASASQSENISIQVDENFLDQAKEQDFCFVEDRPITPYQDRIESIILYKWNRVYPGDFHFDFAPELESWKLKSTESFAGASHEEITKEVYIR